MPRKHKRQMRRSAAAAFAPRREEFHPDYSAVKRDLARIGMLAGFFIVVLIALSFFLR